VPGSRVGRIFKLGEVVCVPQHVAVRKHGVCLEKHVKLIGFKDVQKEQCIRRNNNSLRKVSMTSISEIILGSSPSMTRNGKQKK
jgi:hypothetical protein